jgi:hypothetical protein
MNVIIGKIGKSILFDSSKWGPIGGDNEAPVFYENLFHRNPNVTFYIVGKSDFRKLPGHIAARINRHGNVIDPWKKFPGWHKSYAGDADNEPNSPRTADWVFLKEYMKDIPIDKGIIFAGPSGTSNVFGLTTLMKDPAKIATPLCMLSLFVAPIVQLLNDRRPPWTMILNDPRFFPMFARDLFHWPETVLSQYNETVIAKSRTSYTDNRLVETPVKCVYAGMEKIFLIGRDKEDASTQESYSLFDIDVEPSEITKDIEFLLVLNEGRPSRYGLLKEAILDSVADVDIYGKWDESLVKDDARFKGTVSFHDLQKMLKRVKYSFCIPIKKGWCTMKFWELAHHGIIPFLHKTYDEQNNMGAPPFLRIENAADLKKKIDFLQRRPDAYEKLRAEIKSMIKSSDYSGETLNAAVNL